MVSEHKMLRDGTRIPRRLQEVEVCFSYDQSQKVAVKFVTDFVAVKFTCFSRDVCLTCVSTVFLILPLCNPLSLSG